VIAAPAPPRNQRRPSRGRFSSIHRFVLVMRFSLARAESQRAWLDTNFFSEGPWAYSDCCRVSSSLELATSAMRLLILLPLLAKFVASSSIVQVSAGAVARPTA